MEEQPCGICQSKQRGRPSAATNLPCSFFLAEPADPSHSFAPSHFEKVCSWRPRQTAQAPPRGPAPDGKNSTLSRRTRWVPSRERFSKRSDGDTCSYLGDREQRRFLDEVGLGGERERAWLLDPYTCSLWRREGVLASKALSAVLRIWSIGMAGIVAGSVAGEELQDERGSGIRQWHGKWHGMATARSRQVAVA